MRSWIYAASALALVALTGPAQARPEYARKEGKACVYCHVNPRGGGPRNAMGEYYGSHNHSFAGLNDATSGTPQAPEVNLRMDLAWKCVMAAGTRRVAAGDTTGKNNIRLVVAFQGKKGANPPINIEMWDKATQKLISVASVDTGADGEQMEFGRYSTDRSPVIATPHGYVRKEGAVYSYHHSQDAVPLVGAVRLADGRQALLSLDDINISYQQVDPADKLAAWAAPASGIPAFPPSGLTWAEVRDTLAIGRLAEKYGAPGGRDDLSLLGFWRTGPAGTLTLYRPHHAAGGDNAGDYVALYALAEGGKAASTPAWVSPKLDGKVLDIAPGPDIRTEKDGGFYVLTDNPDADGPTLYYFSPQG